MDDPARPGLPGPAIDAVVGHLHTCATTCARVRLACRAARDAADRRAVVVALSAADKATTGLAPSRVPLVAARFPAATTLRIRFGASCAAAAADGAAAAAALACEMALLPDACWGRITTLELRVGGGAAADAAPALLRQAARLCPAVAALRADAARGDLPACLAPWRGSLHTLAVGRWRSAPAPSAAAALGALSRLQSLRLGGTAFGGAALLYGALPSLPALTALQLEACGAGPAGGWGGGGGAEAPAAPLEWGAVVAALRGGGCPALRRLELEVPVPALLHVGLRGVSLPGVTRLDVTPRCAAPSAR
jgi:hypothetical protein